MDFSIDVTLWEHVLFPFHHFGDSEVRFSISLTFCAHLEPHRTILDFFNLFFFF